MPKISIPVRVRWTLVFILAHFIIFFPYIDPLSMGDIFILWIPLQGPLGMIKEAFTLPDLPLGPFLFVLAWYLCEVLSLICGKRIMKKRRSFPESCWEYLYLPDCFC